MEAYFVGRQPIFDQSGETLAYELLFRSSNKNAYDPSVSGDSATSQVILNAITELGLERVAGPHKVFINLTNSFIENRELLDFLPVGRVVLEVLETVEVTAEVIAGLQELKKAGHTIALDDFVLSEKCAALLPFADIIKYDITQYTADELKSLSENRHSNSVKLLAERVETLEEFQQLRDAGFDYFQGYYFAKPNIVQGRKIPADKTTLLQLMARLNDPNITLGEISEIMSHDVSLGVRALKFVNSPLSGLSTTVTSIQQAAVMLGFNTIRNWVTLMMMANMDEKPIELVKMALIRARFCQLMAKREHIPDDDAFFTIGLLSLLDSIMDMDMAGALDLISATDELRQVLLHREGRASEFLDIVRTFEEPGLVDIPDDSAANDRIRSAYVESIGWAESSALGMAA
ncbi:MAG: HDOD domain-containing protein [Granulosicoccus sp.]|nr:HDOD domain-containing protein [Granulosicoccus sp.]